MDFFVISTAIVFIVSMGIVYLIAGVCAVMAILALYYSFVKRAMRLRAFSKFFKKLQNRETLGFNGHETDKRVQTILCDMQTNPLAFKEFLALSGKDYKRIFISSLIVFLIMSAPIIISAVWVGVVGLMGMDVSQVMKQFFQSHPVGFFVYGFTAVLMALVWALFAFSLPVILILYAMLNQKVKKIMKRLEQFS